jgi:hypothetical protein
MTPSSTLTGGRRGPEHRHRRRRQRDRERLHRFPGFPYLGDGRPFAAYAAVPDGNGNILLAGSTLREGSLGVAGDPGVNFTVGALVVANKIVLPPAPAARLDSAVNFASRMAATLSPGDAIAAIGAGFGADAQLLLDGVPLGGVSRTATSMAFTPMESPPPWHLSPVCPAMCTGWECTSPTRPRPCPRRWAWNW